MMLMSMPLTKTAAAPPRTLIADDQPDVLEALRLLLKGELKDGIAYNTEHGVPNIEIDVNGQKVKTDIDSGSPALVSLPLSLAKSLTLSSEPRVVGKGRTMDGEFDVYAAPLKGEIRIGSIILKDPQIDMVSVFPVGNIGFQFLRTLNITFDPANRRVRFEKSKT